MFLGPPSPIWATLVNTITPCVSKIRWAPSLAHIIRSSHTKFCGNRTSGFWARVSQNFGTWSCILKLCGRINFIIVWMVVRLFIEISLRESLNISSPRKFGNIPDYIDGMAMYKYIAILGIAPHWSALIDLGINARILIGIDRHWALIEGVLQTRSSQMVWHLFIEFVLKHFWCLAWKWTSQLCCLEY